MNSNNYILFVKSLLVFFIIFNCKYSYSQEFSHFKKKELKNYYFNQLNINSNLNFRIESLKKIQNSLFIDCDSLTKNHERHLSNITKKEQVLKARINDYDVLKNEFDSLLFLNNTLDDSLNLLKNIQDKNLIILSSIEWQKCYGGTFVDKPISFKQTLDSGFIVSAFAYSEDIDVIKKFKNEQLWIFKINKFGNIEWQDNLIGSENCYPFLFNQYNDGSYFLAYYYNHGNLAMAKFNVFKYDNNGKVFFNKFFEYKEVGLIKAIFQTKDNGFITAGSEYLVDNNKKVYGEKSITMKFDSFGEIEWKKQFYRDELPSKIIQTNDDGFLIVGFNIKNETISGNKDYLLYFRKIDKYGSILWQNNFNDEKYNNIVTYKEICDIKQTNDFGAIIAITIQHYYSPKEIQLIKINKLGEIEWKIYWGGDGDNTVSSIIQTNDDGFIISGTTTSKEIFKNEFNGKSDALIIKFNKRGKVMWQKCFGGTNYDSAEMIQQIDENSFIFIGTTRSNDKCVQCNNQGNDDIWVLKFNSSNY